MLKSPHPMPELVLEESELFKNIQQIEDPRTRWTRHKLSDILIIAIMAVICGADDWNAIETYGEAKKEWLSGFLELPNGIPSHDTFNNLMSRIDPIVFADCCLAWMREAAVQIGAQIISIDGKSLNNSYDREKGQKSLHLVSAWVSSHQLLLGQVKTEEKSNEITAIPKLLDLIDIKGHIVTIDAIGCQKAIAQTIVARGGDYIIGLKGNQGNLHKTVEESFAKACTADWVRIPHEYHETLDTGHGRTEKRQYWLIPTTAIKIPDGWETVQSVVMVKREREDWRQTSKETHFYISSLTADVKKIGAGIRSHWGVEEFHWSLDVTFAEDDSRIRSGSAAENFATMRRQALGILKKDTSLKKSIRLKRYHAAMNNDYLVRILVS
jgi:predicted transposase YbfD/YdcC